MSRKQNTQSKSDSTEPSGVIANKATKNPEKNQIQHKQSIRNGVDRHEMIAMAAYYRSQKRDFNNGDEIQDWLNAEAEVDGLI